MSARTAGRLGWSIWAVSAALAALGLVLAALNNSLPDLALPLYAVMFPALGALIVSRHPRHAVGWICCAIGFCFSLDTIGQEYAVHALVTDPATLPAGEWAEWLESWIWIPGVGLLGTFLLLLFPNGRLLSRRWRVAALLAGSGIAIAVLGQALKPGAGEFAPPGYANPLGVEGIGIAVDIGTGLLVAGVVASVASIVVRFRRATGLERLQLKWVTYSAAGLAIFFAGSFLGPVLLLAAVFIVLRYRRATNAERQQLRKNAIALFVVAILVASALFGAGVALGPEAPVGLFHLLISATIPIALGIAILRHGLYDIDVVINRTLVYGALTATLGAAYLGSVLLLQLALSPLTQQSDLAIVGSTLGVAALFRPARGRIQAIVDRRFYRRKYDAEKTLEAFSARLRDEVDLDSLSAELQGVVRETMQPAHVSLWLRAPEATR